MGNAIVGDIQFLGSMSVGTMSTSQTSRFLVSGNSETTDITSTGGLKFNTSYTGATQVIGEIRWDSVSGFPNFKVGEIGFDLPIGGRNLVRVINESGSGINKGKVVCVAGIGTGDIIKIREAINSDITRKNVLGFVTEDIGNGNTGFVTTFGILSEIDTQVYTQGLPIYLGNSSGDFTESEPDAPNHLVKLGFIVKSGASGQIFVNIEQGYGLMDLYDVYNYATASMATGSYIAWSPVHNYWEVLSPMTATCCGGTNGISDISGQLGLGGNLIQNTTISGDGNQYELLLDSLTNFRVTNFNGLARFSGSGASTFSVNTGEIEITSSSKNISLSAGLTLSQIALSMDFQFNNAVVTDNSGASYGLVYANDYTAGFVTHSLVTKGYVDSVSGTFTGSGTTNYVTRWTTNTQLGTGSIYDSGTAVGIATQSDSNYALNIYGDVKVTGGVTASKDIEVTDLTKGIILKSPNGTRWRVTVDNTGALVTTAI